LKRVRKTKAKPKPRPHPGFIPIGALLPVLPPAPDVRAGPPCHLCPALCCKYFAIEIDRPITPQDHDEVRWYLMHDKVGVWALDGDWYLEVRTVCRNLRPDNSCAIYETRPQICREYGVLDKEGPCEYFSQDVPYDLLFETVEKFEEWSRADLARRAERLQRRREARRMAAVSR
jgi:Fe-S-cluster containining protein